MAASLAAIVPLALSACGTAVGATRAGGGHKIVINALFSQYSNFDGLTEILTKRGAEFEKAHPQYQVNVQFADYQQLPEDVAKDAQNGTVPTIASYNTSGTRFALDTLDKNGKPVFTPVAPAIGGRRSILGEPVVANDLLPAASRYYSYRGQLFAMPLSISTLQLYANMTLLKKAGIQTIPRTYADVTAACAAIAKLNPAPAHCVGFADEAKLFQQAMTQAGTPITDNDNGRSNRATTVDLNSPEMVAYATWWQQLNRAGYFLDTHKIEDWAGTFGAFAGQQVAFTETSSFVVPTAEKLAKAGGFELGVGPSPSSQPSSAGTWLGGDGMYLAAGLNPATRDGALAFMQFLDNPKNGAEWQQVYGSAPVTNGVFGELKAEGFYDQNPGDLVTVQQLTLSANDPGGQPALVGAFAGIQESLMRAFDDIVSNNADPAQRLNRAESFAQELLTDYNAHCLVTGVVPDYCYSLDT